MKKPILILALLVFVVLFSGCTAATQPNPTTSFILGNFEFVFRNDINEALKVDSGNQDIQIKNLVENSNWLNIAFDASSKEDSAYFRVMLIDFVSKLSAYRTHTNNPLNVTPYYLLNNTWFNKEDNITAAPASSIPTIWIKGPHTGGLAGNFVKLENKTITLSGKDFKGLTLAGDKLSLILIGVGKIEDIQNLK